MNKISGYFHSVHFLRGLAALIVCLFHLLRDTNLNYIGFVGRIIEHGHLGVQVFFVISGFVIPLSMYKGKYDYRNIGTFFLKRLSRLEPPYVATIFIILVLNYITSLTPFNEGEFFGVDYLGLILHFGYLNAFFQEGWLNPVFWTLAIEFQFYILISVIYPVLQKRDLFGLAMLILLIALSYVLPNPSLLFKHIPFFGIGFLCFKYLADSDNRNRVLYIICSIFLFLTIFYNHSEIKYVIASIIPIPFILFWNFKSTIGTFLGNISYSLYLLHVPIGQRIIKLNILNTNKLVIIEYSIVFASLAITIIASYLLYRLIERPSMKLSHNIAYKNKLAKQH